MASAAAATVTQLGAATQLSSRRARGTALALAPRRRLATSGAVRVVSMSASTSPTPHRGTITGTAAAAPAVTDATSTSLEELQEAAGYFLKSAPNDLKFQRTVRGKGTIYGSVPRAPGTGTSAEPDGRRAGVHLIAFRRNFLGAPLYI